MVDTNVVSVPLQPSEYALLRAWARANAGTELAAEVQGALVNVVMPRRVARGLRAELAWHGQTSRLAEAIASALDTRPVG